MEITLRYQCQKGDRWVEQHRLLQTGDVGDGQRSATEKTWNLEHEVLEVSDGQCRIRWRKNIASEGETSGEIWVDQLARNSQDRKTWSAPLFPEKPLQLGTVWSQENPALNALVHFKLESADDKTATIVSECDADDADPAQEVRATFTICRKTGRVLRSTNATLSQNGDGLISETVLEVNVKEN